MTGGENGGDSHAGWAGRDAELDALADSMLGMTSAEARELAAQHAVKLRVEDRMSIAYTRSCRPGRISVQAYGGTVTRAQRG